MRDTSFLNRAMYGEPIKKVELDIRKKRTAFAEISTDLVEFGAAAGTILEMRKMVWYLTDGNHLVPSDIKDLNLPIIRLRIVVDENISWLAKRAQRTNWNNFGIPVRIVRNELDKCYHVVFLEKSEQKKIAQA